MKISIPTPRNVIGNSNREGLSTAQIYKGKYEAILEIPGGGGGGGGGGRIQMEKRIPWGRDGYFLEPHILYLKV